MFNENDSDCVQKHELEKEGLVNRVKQDHFGQMKYYLDCGFNLLIFGVGSKRGIVNNFV